MTSSGKPPRSSWGHKILIAIDQLGNACCDGNPDETISSRVGRNALQGDRWALIAQRFINWLFRNPRHCQDAIENLRGDR